MSRPPARWTSEKLYLSGDQYFSDLIKAISNAKSSVEMESYIFLKGTLGDRLVEQLIAAAGRGVRVRLIVDGWGSPNFLYDYWPQLKAAGVRTRFFRVIPWILRRLPGDPGGFWQRLLQRWRNMNRGNHRKFCLIDDSQLFVGSYNVSDVHLKEVSGADTWKDIGVRVEGPDLKYARRAFQRAYRGWSALNWPARNPRLLLLNDSMIHKRHTRSEHIQRIRSAERRVWLATPYFVPIGAVYRLLARQARRGVDVRLQVPLKSDVPFVQWMSLPLLKDLAKEGVKIFVFQPTFSHQKVFIADDWMCIGSTNLNHRSFLHDLEMDVVIGDEKNRQALEANYLADQARSEPFDRSAWANVPIWQRALSFFSYLLKYWA